MKKIMLALAVTATALMFGLAVLPASATAEAKVVVCKYVSTPGGVLDHIIIVDDNTLGNAQQPWPGTLPFIWTDAQGQTEVGSIAVRFANEGEQSHDVPLSDCPQTPVTTPPPPPPPPPPSTTVPPPPPPPPPPTTTAPPTTTTTTPPPVPCKGSVALGPWYGDPRINVSLRGAGTFVISGGVQRFSGLHTITKTLACNETFKVGRYKIKNGHYLTITQDGVVVTHITPPRV